MKFSASALCLWLAVVGAVKLSPPRPSNFGYGLRDLSVDDRGLFRLLLFSLHPKRSRLLYVAESPAKTSLQVVKLYNVWMLVARASFTVRTPRPENPEAEPKAVGSAWLTQRSFSSTTTAPKAKTAVSEHFV
ncbi:hypothetical protein JOM56_004650 [Amanita muscaria]